MTITFTNKESYLHWAAEWKNTYAQLSDEIRRLKFARWCQAKPKDRVSEAQTARYNLIAKDYPSPYGFYANSILQRKRAEATAMLELRKESKVRAQEQYLAAKNAPAAIA